VSEVLGRLPDLPDVELVAVAMAGSDAGAARSALRNPAVAKAARYDDYASMLARERLDLAAVCNNDGERAAAVAACAGRQLNVIAEKPLAISRAQLDTVLAAVEKHRVRAGMLLPMRFDPPYLAMKQVVESGEIGAVLQIDGQKSYQLGERPEWQKNARTYGSTILWIGIHMLDLMTFTSGRAFTHASSFQARVGFPAMRDMETVTASIFRLDNGGTATLRMDYLRPASAKSHGDDRLRLAGTKGVVEYQEETGVTVMSAQGKRRLEGLPPQGSVFLDFLKAAYLGAAPALACAEIVRVNRATLAAHEAAEQGKIVTV